jgi:hypothetical protein
LLAGLAHSDGASGMQGPIGAAGSAGAPRTNEHFHRHFKWLGLPAVDFDDGIGRTTQAERIELVIRQKTIQFFNHEVVDAKGLRDFEKKLDRAS